jgi:phage baseplate assembly protein gpV
VNNLGISINGKITSTGNIQSTGGNIIAGNGVELEGHHHTYVPGTSGSASTSGAIG